MAETVVKGKKHPNKPSPSAWNPPTPKDSKAPVYGANGIRTRTNYTLRSKVSGEAKVPDLAQNYVPFQQVDAKDLDSLLKYLKSNLDSEALLEMVVLGVNGSARSSAAFREARIHGIARSMVKVRPSLPFEKALAKARADVSSD